MVKVSMLMAWLPLCTMVHSTSPCSEYFTDMTEFGSDVLGKIEIPFPPEKDKDFYLRVALDIAEVLSPKDWYVRLELARSINESIRAVQQGRSLLYHVHFPSHSEPIPTLSAIWFNNQRYCPPNGNIRGNIELGHIVFANEEPFSQKSWLNPSRRNVSTYRINNPTYYRLNYLHPNHSRPTTIVLPERMATSYTRKQENGNILYSESLQFNNDSINDDNNECGISSHTGSTIDLLIFNGGKTYPGQWPWLVALFIVKNVRYKFQCAGTLLTNRHVLTAGHCLKFGNTNDTIPSNVLMVTLGQFKLYQFREMGTVNREVASYTIHPEYAHADTGDSDLAILTLRTPVEYSPFIRPICLWSGTTSLQNVVNRTGYVVGWGRDESGYSYTEEPRMARVPIVSHEDCLWSDPIFVTLTSHRTFCAGSRNGSGPCNGDSGSGLVIFDAATNRYQLRGVVSRSVRGTEPLCNLKKYVVYVDVAKYIPWIQQRISIM